jgi:hypothetical protein
VATDDADNERAGVAGRNTPAKGWSPTPTTSATSGVVVDARARIGGVILVCPESQTESRPGEEALATSRAARHSVGP